ncbi:MAG: hypothetical protein WDN00_07040 [Limisphaerales bacterium]
MRNLAFIGTERGCVHHLQLSSRQARWLFLGENNMPQAGQLVGKIKVMGDKSPKANQKKSGQKDSKTNSSNAKKNAAQAAKSSAPKKK